MSQLLLMMVDTARAWWYSWLVATYIYGLRHGGYGWWCRCCWLGKQEKERESGNLMCFF